MRTKSSMTIEDKLVVWLSVKRKTNVASHELTAEFMPWMMERYGYKGALSIHRAWREMREKGVFETREIDSDTADSRWEILSYRGEPWILQGEPSWLSNLTMEQTPARP